MSGYVRMRIGDLSGRIMDELEAQIDTIAWRLDAASRINATIAATDPKATEQNLRFGNRVLLDFENGLPFWGGVIDEPREWNNRVISFTLYSALHILGWRQTEESENYKNTSGGGIFRDQINKANARGSTGITPGTVEDDGTDISTEYHSDKVSDILTDDLSGNDLAGDFDLVPSIVNGIIVFTANYYKAMGRDLTASVRLVEGINIEGLEFVEQGPIINSWVVTGKGSQYDEDRGSAKATDDDSIAKYGLREGEQSHSETDEGGTLQEIADTLLDESKNPRNRIRCRSHDIDPAKFANYAVGDTITLESWSVGFGRFTAPVRIITREYDPEMDICDLVVQEVIS